MSHPVIAQECAEVRGLLLVDQLNKVGTVHRVDRRENAAREEAKLQELCYGLVLCGLCRKNVEVGSNSSPIGHLHYFLFLQQRNHSAHASDSWICQSMECRILTGQQPVVLLKFKAVQNPLDMLHLLLLLLLQLFLKSSAALRLLLFLVHRLR